MAGGMWRKAAGLALGMLVAGASAAGAGPRFDDTFGHDWSGLYVGAHGGWAWGDASYELVFKSGPQSGSFGFDGWLGGAAIGYDFQHGNLVLGVVGDISIGDLSGSGEAFDGDDISARMSFLGSLRARFGYAFGNVMPYLTGGAAFAKTEVACCSGVLSDSAYHWGWTAGGGVEMALNDRLSAAIEYRYTDLDPESLALAKSFTTSGWAKLHTVLARLNWRLKP